MSQPNRLPCSSVWRITKSGVKYTFTCSCSCWFDFCTFESLYKLGFFREIESNGQEAFVCAHVRVHIGAVRCWFTQLWRLRCDKVCKLETQGTHHYSSSLSLKSGDWWPSTKTSRESEFFLTLPFILPTQMGWTRPSHIEGGPSALLSSPVQKLISSGNAFIDTLRIMFNQISRCSTAQSR